MIKSWGLIPKIVSGEKSIESRWYQTKRAPWGKISRGDTVYFKNSGEPVTAKATVADVVQFELHNLADAKQIAKKYGKRICMVQPNPNTWEHIPRYCILISSKNPKQPESPGRSTNPDLVPPPPG